MQKVTRVAPFQPVRGKPHSRFAREVKDPAVDDSRPERRPQFRLPKGRVIGARKQALCRQNTRSDGMAHPEARERVLKPGMFANHRMTALQGRSGQAYVAVAAEGARVVHPQGGVGAKEFFRCGDMFGLVAKLGEHAACDRAAPVPDQQIGVTARREILSKRQPGPIGHIGLKDMSRRDYIGLSRPRGQNAGPVKILYPVAKSDFDAGGTGLCQKRAIQRARARSAADEIEQGPPPAHPVVGGRWRR